MKRKEWISLVAVVLVVGGIVASLYRSRPPARAAPPGRLQVVAGEDFWGSLLSQLGGERVHVVSVVSDPNADPHEYETNAAIARVFAQADYVVLNGAGYDSWGDKLLRAGGKPGRKVLTIADLLGKKGGDNPHFWYDPEYVSRVMAQMRSDLTVLDAGHADYYAQQYRKLRSSLAPYQDRIASIRRQFGGTKVAATESIFAYLARAAGLDLVSPPAFMDAVAEGNDPSPQSVVEFQDQLKSGQVKVLVYNRQTVTPLTENIKKLAGAHGIPVIGVTETIQPPDLPFQDWMNAELITLQNALKAEASSR